MNIVFIIGIVESLFFFLIVLTKKEKTIADIVFSIWLLLIALHLLFPLLFYSNYPKYIHLIRIDIGLPILQAILFFLYVKFSLYSTISVRINFIIHAMSFIIVCALTIPWVLLDKEIKLQFLNNQLGLPIYIWITFFAIYSILFTYLIIIVRLIIKYHRNQKNVLSCIELRSVKWLRDMAIYKIVFYFFTSLIGSILFFAGLTFFNIDYFGYTLLVLSLFVLGFFGIRQKNVFSNHIAVEKNPYTKQVVINEKDILFAQKLEDFMANQRPYLNEILTLHELSKLLGVKPYYITFILNRVIKKNFYDFVNYYRIEEIKNRILAGETSKYTILSIAFDCGFNSKASFNRIFKSFTGNSPTEYIHLISN